MGVHVFIAPRVTETEGNVVDRYQVEVKIEIVFITIAEFLDVKLVNHEGVTGHASR